MGVQASAASFGSTLREVRPRRRLTVMRVVGALMLREMATTYGRSPGGYLWAVLEPVGGIALLSIIFSLGFRNPPIGSNFPIFYATGLVPFLAYMDISNKLASAMQYSRQLLSYPCVTYLDALFARFALNALTQLLVAFLLFAGIMLAFETRTVLDFPAIVLGFAMAGAVAFGVGTLNCFLTRLFPLWQRIWTIISRPLLFISGVIFLFDAIPEPYRGFLWYNPLIHVVGQVRSGFYPYYEATYVSPLYVFGLSLVLCATGLVFLRRYNRDLLNN